MNKRIKIFFLTALLSFPLLSCDHSSRDRPPGYIRLGPVNELLANESELEEQKLLLRRDAGGFYVMSTMCTYDLTYLKRSKDGAKEIYTSTYTDSKYDLNGKVLSGPSVKDLPYYELKVDSGDYGGPKNTLYVYINKKVAPEWRLNIEPTAFPTATPLPE